MGWAGKRPRLHRLLCARLAIEAREEACKRARVRARRAHLLTQTLPPSSHRRYGEPAYSGKVAAFDLVSKKNRRGRPKETKAACTKEAVTP